MSATESDISGTLAAKSDQLNADDLKPSGVIGHPITVRIVSVVVRDTDDQPMTIKVDGYLPYRPCKSMRRVLAAAWGKDATKWKGREMTLYTDPDVSFGDQKKIGGIRISHLSHIDGPMTLNLTATKGRKAPWKVLPIAQAAAAWTAGQDHASWEADREAFAAELLKVGVTVERLDGWLNSEDGAELRKWWNGSAVPELRLSWVPTRWRANLVKRIAADHELTKKINAPQQGD